MFRFEYYENVISKHHLKAISWKQCAEWSLTNTNYKTGVVFGSGAMTIASVRNIDEDTVEIIKRRDDSSRPWFYKWGADKLGLYERVIINRKECTVAVDRMDENYRIKGAFLGRRDYFYVEQADKEAILNMAGKQERLAFVRHDFWLHKMWKLPTVLASNFSAPRYKSAFKTISWNESSKLPAQ